MTKSRAYVGAVAALCFLSACQDGTPTALEAEAEIERAACEALTYCMGQIHDTDALYVAMALSGDCGSLTEADAEWYEVLRRGHVRVDEARYDQCREDIAACRSFSTECRRVFVGTLHDGAACIDGNECISGNCTGNRYSGVCGVCEGEADLPVLAALGEPCFWDDECAPVSGEAAACEVTGASGMCVLRVTVSEGDPCTASSLACPSGTFCDSAGICSRPLPVGAACVDGDNCVRGAYCNHLNENPTICRRVLLRGEGETCGPGASPGDFVFCDRSRSLACDSVSGTCVAAPPAGRDEPCSNGPVSCAAGLYCEQGVCVDQLPVGAVCVGDPWCASGRCVYDPPNGSHCGDALPICE